MVGTLNQSEGGVRGGGVRRGARRGVRGGVCGGVRGGVCRGVRGGGARRGARRGAFVLDCHWLPLATSDLVGDNREFEAFRHILSCYNHYSWLIVLDFQSFITICPWLPSVAPSNH